MPNKKAVVLVTAVAVLALIAAVVMMIMNKNNAAEASAAETEAVNVEEEYAEMTTDHRAATSNPPPAENNDLPAEITDIPDTKPQQNEPADNPMFEFDVETQERLDQESESLVLWEKEVIALEDSTLPGTWKGISVSVGSNDYMYLTYVFNNGTYTFIRGEITETGTYKVTREAGSRETIYIDGIPHSSVSPSESAFVLTTEEGTKTVPFHMNPNADPPELDIKGDEYTWPLYKETPGKPISHEKLKESTISYD
jgi:hypothetical protein